MKTYPKHILSINDQIQTYIDGGLIITNMDEVKEALMSIGYYRLRGYSFHLYNKTIKQYQNGISFSDILRLYQFDIHLSGLLLSMILIIEVALRARFIDAFLKLGDPLIYLDSSVFTDKQNFWSNIASISNEVARSRDVFIEHNFKKHDGQVHIILSQGKTARKSFRIWKCCRLGFILFLYFGICVLIILEFIIRE